MDRVKNGSSSQLSDSNESNGSSTMCTAIEKQMATNSAPVKNGGPISSKLELSDSKKSNKTKMDINKLTLKELNTVDDGGESLNQQCDTEVLLSTIESPTSKNTTEKKVFKRSINLDEDAPCVDQQRYFAVQIVDEKCALGTVEKVCLGRSVLQSDACFVGLGEKEKMDLMLSKIKTEELTAKKYEENGLRLKSSLVLDIIPQDDKSNIKETESTIRAIKLGTVVWGPSKLINCGDGILKLRICCDLEQGKTSVNQLIEFMEEIKSLGQNVDIVGFKGPSPVIYKQKEPLLKRIKLVTTPPQSVLKKFGLMTFEEFLATLKSDEANVNEGSENFFNLVLNQECDADVVRTAFGRFVKCSTDQALTEKNVMQPLDTSLSEEEKMEEEMKKIQTAELAAKLRRKRGFAAESTFQIDVMFQENESNVNDMEARIKSIEMNTLVWGPSKFIDRDDGIRALSIRCRLEADKTSLHQLIASIKEIVNLAQNINIVEIMEPSQVC